MADSATDAPAPVTKPPDAAKEVATPAAIAAANTGASEKAAVDAYGLPVGTKSTAGDGHTPVTDATHPATDADEHDGIAHAAAQAYDKTAGTTTAKADAPKAPESGYLDFSTNSVVADGKPGDGKGAKVDVKDGQVAVSNDKVSATRTADGTDTVTDNRSGEKVTRDATTHKITDQAGDRTTEVGKEHVKDEFHNFTMKRDLVSSPASGDTPPKPGEGKQTKDSVSYADASGLGTGAAKDDNTISLAGSNGDTLVLNGAPNASPDAQVTYTEKGGQPQTMSLDQYKAAHGDQFAGFNLDSTTQVTDAKDGAVLQAQAGAASLSKTDATTGEVVKDTVNANGTSQLTHTDAQGNSLGNDSTVNYNNPGQAYQQLDAQGNVLANYDANSGNFNGNGYSFNANGMQISGGDVFVGDDGTYSADSYSDSVSTDGSMALYTAAGMDGSQMGSNNPMGTELTQDVNSTLLLAGNDLDALMAVNDATGGRLVGLDAKIASLEDKSDRQASWQERKANRDERDNTYSLNAPGYLDLSKDIYAA
jgi:hypothetical protein